MIGIDTNVLVRFLTADEPLQSKQSRALVAERPELQPVFINVIVLVEAAWVLSRHAGIARQQSLLALRAMLDSDDFVIERSGLVEQALEDALAINCDFADALIARINNDAGCRTTASFDMAATRLKHMTAVTELI